VWINPIFLQYNILSYLRDFLNLGAALLALIWLSEVVGFWASVLFGTVYILLNIVLGIFEYVMKSYTQTPDDDGEDL
jgi:hypothetical protein